jgi:hypothetical protein
MLGLSEDKAHSLLQLCHKREDSNIFCRTFGINHDDIGIAIIGMIIYIVYLIYNI